MFKWILRYLGLDNRQTKTLRNTRMTEKEALQVARSVVERSPDADNLQLAKIVDEEEIIWVFSTASRGNPLVIHIRDQDGAVIRKERIGRR